MKNVNAKHQESILDCIRKTPNVALETIKEQTKISDILIRSLLKGMLTDNLIAVNPDDGTYSINPSEKKVQPQTKDTKADKKEAVKAEVKTIPKKDKKKEVEEELGPATVSRRDYSKFDFNGIIGLTKGRLVLAVVQQYSTDKKPTLAKLEEVFKSKEIQPRYGVLEEVSKAKKHTKNNRERYFLKPEELIKAGNQKAAVTNQWSAETLNPILAIAKGLGYKVTVSK